jgi:hypothetical protein
LKNEIKKLEEKNRELENILIETNNEKKKEEEYKEKVEMEEKKKNKNEKERRNKERNGKMCYRFMSNNNEIFQKLILELGMMGWIKRYENLEKRVD